MVEFRATIENAARGGHYVAVPDEIVAAIGGKHMLRVKGTLAGATYRSNLARTGGRMILGVHKATLQAAGRAAGDEVEISVEPDNEPRER